MRPAWRPSREQVDAAEAAAHAADEVADCAGLLLADSVLDHCGETRLLALKYRAARMEAGYRWAAFEDVRAQHNAGAAVSA